MPPLTVRRAQVTVRLKPAPGPLRLDPTGPSPQPQAQARNLDTITGRNRDLQAD